MTDPRFPFSFDAEALQRVVANGRIDRCRWDELTRVDIVTSNAGPWAEDVFWRFSSAAQDATCVVSNGEIGPLLPALGMLAGWDDGAVIEAMGCTDNAIFVVWEGAPGDAAAVGERLANQDMAQGASPLLARFQQAWVALGANPERAEDVLSTLVAQYGDANRRYHTLRHVEACLALLDEFSALADRPAEVELALFFHDAVYAPLSTKNERRSADQAVSVLRRAGADSDAIERVRVMILATRDHASAENTDVALVNDIDLSILGADHLTFKLFQLQVRSEFRVLPDWLYTPLRRRFFRALLNRPSIFQTPAFKSRFESAARQNVALALRRST